MNDRGMGTFIFGALIGAALLWFFFFRGKHGMSGGCSGCAGAGAGAGTGSSVIGGGCAGSGTINPGKAAIANNWSDSQAIGYQARNGTARIIQMPTYGSVSE